MQCHRCGHVNTPPPSWRGDLIWRCTSCKALWDQDENAARNLLAAAVGASGDAAVTVAARENKGLRRGRITRKGSARKSPPKSLNDGAPL
jgi:transposase